MRGGRTKVSKTQGDIQHYVPWLQSDDCSAMVGPVGGWPYVTAIIHIDCGMTYM